MRGRGAFAGLSMFGLLLTGCGGDDGGGGEVFEIPSSVVCDGEGYEPAPAVGSGIDTAVVYVNGGGGWDFTSWSTIPEDVRSTVPEEASLAVCATVTQPGNTLNCDFEDEGDEFRLVVSEATYDVAIRAASTGEVLEQGSVTSEPAECPLITSWTEGEGTRTEYADADVTELLAASGASSASGATSATGST